MTTKAKGESIRVKLKNLSSKLNVKYSDLETVFLIERLVARLISDKAETDLNDGVWFRFESQVDLATQGEYGGIRHVYRAGIGEVLKNLKKAQVVNFDLGIGDPVTPAPQNVVTHGDLNSRSKDIHDLAIFLPKTDRKTLREAIQKSFVFRGTDVPPSFLNVLKELDTTRLEKGWANAVSSVKNASSFKTAFKVLMDHIADWEK